MKLYFRICAIPYDEYIAFNPGHKNHPYIAVDKDYVGVYEQTDLFFIWDSDDYYHQNRKKHRKKYYLYEYKKL